MVTKDWSLYDPMKKPVFSYPCLSSDEIAYYLHYGLKGFYLRPRYIFDRLLSIRGYSDVNKYLVNFVVF